MNYLKNIINTDGAYSSFKDGLIYVKNILKLELAKTEAKERLDFDKQHIRDCQLDVTKIKDATDNETVIQKILGEKYQARRQTKVFSQGTVFGKKGCIQLDFSQHSHYGMNPQFLNEDGVPNPAAVMKRLREIAPSTELKEQRLNYYFNVNVVGDFYDNATSLLFVILQKINIFKMIKKTPTKKHTYVITARKALDLFNESNKICEQNIRKFISEGKFMMTVAEGDFHMYTIMEDFKTWYATLPKQELTDDKGYKVPNPAFENQIFNFEILYWECYKYRDGHSYSGTHFGDVFGMTHNRFKVPSELNMSRNYPNMAFTPHTMDIPHNDATISNMRHYKYFINGTGLNKTELSALLMCCNGNKRCTPFLIDQDVDLGIEDGRVEILRAEKEIDLPEVVFEIRDLQSMLAKLVTTHKWHEELKAAATAMKYWLAQPATETMESHWWLNIHRTLCLPKLGLRRAILPMLLEGDGAGISKEALVMAKKLVSSDDFTITESLVANATWYWGEYLYQFNSSSLRGLFHKMDNEYIMSLSPLERADGMSSGVLGVAVPRPIFKQMGTYITRGLESHYRDTILFGQIHVEGAKDYGYTLTEEKLSTNTLVCPSCTGLITGLGGSLLNGTPYHALFKINPSVYKETRTQHVQAYNYYDLWAYGVVQRWQGYDVSYKHPRVSHTHKIYAANNVSVAMPPVNPGTMESVCSYQIMPDQEREYGFGSSIEWIRHCESYFTWHRNGLEVLREPEYHALPLAAQAQGFLNVDRITVSTHAPQAHNVLLYATYDAVVSDFQVNYLEMAVPLRVDAGPLQLAEIDTGPEAHEPPGGAQESAQI